MSITLPYAGQEPWDDVLNAALTSLQDQIDEVRAGTNVVLAVVTTAERPAATTVGAVLYDSDLSKPIYSNGTVWKDAAGVTV